MRLRVLQRLQVLTLLSGLLLSNSFSASAQLISSKSFKADHTADEQKGLAISSTGEMYMSINAKSLNLLNEDDSYSDIVNKLNTTARAGILAKIDTHGKLLWSGVVSTINSGAKNSQITSVCEMGDYLYVTGGVCVSSAAKARVSVFGIELESQGFMDYYLAKLNAKTGEPIWAKIYGNNRDWEMFNSVVVDDKGNIYAVATFGNVVAAPLELPLKNGSKTSLSVTGNWGEDYLLVKFNTEGEILWANNIGSNFRENGVPSVAIDKDGNAIVCGIFNAANGNLTAETEAKREFSIGDQKYMLYPAQSKESAMVKMASTDGAIMWSRYFTGIGHQEIAKVAVLESPNRIVVTGTADNAIIVKGSNDFLETTQEHPAGANHAFVMAFDANGTFLWNKSATDDASTAIKAMVADKEGNVLIAGSFNGALTFDGITMEKTGSGAQEGFFAKFNKDGKCLYMETVKGTGADNINLLAINGDRLAIAGDRATDVILPYGDIILGKSSFTVNGSSHKWFLASYIMKPSLTGIATIEGRRSVTFNYKFVPAFFNMPSQFVYTKPTVMPQGWEMNETTGVISGKATAEGSGSITLKVTNALDNSTVERIVAYTIVPKPCDILAIMPESIALKAVTGPFNQKFTLENGEGVVGWSAQGLPAGLSINSKTGVVSGILSQTGNTSFTINAREESGCDASRSYAIETSAYNYSLAPSVKWSNQIYATDAMDHAKINAIDKDGNIWVAASYFSAGFSETVSFPHVGNTDALVAKYNGATGDFMMSRRIGGSEVSGRNEQGQAVAVDPQTGDAVFTGIMNPDAYIGDMGETTTHSTNGARDALVVRFDKDGKKLWHRTFGSSADWEAGINTIFDKKGNIYMVGYSGNKDIVVSVAGESETLAGTTSDALIFKLAANGDCLWVKRLGTTNGGDEIYGLAIDENNNVYVAGMMNNGTVAFGNDKTMIADGIATYVSKFDENGACQWITTIGGKGSFITGRGSVLQVDKQGNIYLGGIAKGSSAIAEQTQTIEATSTTLTDGVVLKLNNKGEYVSHKLIASESNDGVTSLAVDKDNNVYAVGYYEAELTAYESIRLQLNGTSRTAFVFKYNQNLDYVYAFSTGSIVTDATRPSNLGISVDNNSGDLMITGPYYGYAYPYGMSGKSTSLSNTARFLLLCYSHTANVFGVFPDAKRGEMYNAVVSVNGFNDPTQLVYSVDSGALPAGLTLNSKTGEVTGTLTGVGVSKFTIKATDGAVTATKEFVVAVLVDNCELSIDFDAAFASGSLNGVPFSGELYADYADGIVTWSLEDGSSLPQGLTIGSKSSDVGVISGVPNAPAKEYSFTVVAQDENGCRVARQIYLTIMGESSLDRNFGGKLVILPNPIVDGKLKLKVGDQYSGEYLVEVIDNAGNILKRENTLLNAGTVAIFYVQDIPSGAYFVRISNDKNVITLSFIIQ